MTHLPRIGLQAAPGLGLRSIRSVAGARLTLLPSRLGHFCLGLRLPPTINRRPTVRGSASSPTDVPDAPDRPPDDEGARSCTRQSMAYFFGSLQSLSTGTSHQGSRHFRGPHSAVLALGPLTMAVFVVNGRNQYPPSMNSRFDVLVTNASRCVVGRSAPDPREGFLCSGRSRTFGATARRFHRVVVSRRERGCALEPGRHFRRAYRIDGSR